jgi:hypothetical protein
MTNKHIELVKKWQAGEILSAEEMRANAADAADAEAADGAGERAVCAANAAWLADHEADSESVDYWIKKYEEITNEK